jgi:putative heme-binding domain-containing protein
VAKTALLNAALRWSVEPGSAAAEPGPPPPVEANFVLTGMRLVNPPGLILGLLLPLGLMGAEPVDPYANDPYWYQPGHAVEPADATAIRTPPGFHADRILTVPREWGSWTALAVEAGGALIAAAQHQPGLFRVTLPALDQGEAATQVERMGGAAAEIGWAHGLLHAFDSLYVTVAEEGEVSTGVYRLQDTTGDGVYDRSTRLFELQGMGEHGPHGLVVGPDGASIVMIIGNGTAVPDTITMRRPTATEGVDRVLGPGFESSRYSTQGWVLRFAPDGSERELISSGLRNPYDLACHPRGDLFTFDSDDEWDLGTPWYRPTRIVQLVSGGEYGWRGGGAVWPDHAEDSVGPVLNMGPGSPTGMAFGHGSGFPKRYQDALFVGDWTFGAIHALFLQPEGAGYAGEAEEFLGGAGLPVTDLVFAPDGALYVAVGGRRLGSAVYRVRYVGAPEPEESPTDDGVPPLHALRRELEQYHGHLDPTAVEAAWRHLGHPDRWIRFAARVAVESQPLAEWRERGWTESDPAAELTALLALARQGNGRDLARIVERLARVPWQELDAATMLRWLRIAELALARSGEKMTEETDDLLAQLRRYQPHGDAQILREVARLRAWQGDRQWIPLGLDAMAADTGEKPAVTTDYFARNPKYGQAVRDMLEAAPLLERMHHAQMLLWLVEQFDAPQRQRYFALIGDAMNHSKGGHLYQQFWERIRDAALARVPEAERAPLAELAATPVEEEGELPVPRGPGRDWTVAELAEVSRTRLHARDFTNGRRMYAAASCRACHRLGGEGGVAGPSLAGLGDRFTLRDVLEAVVEPSRAVSDQYRLVVLETKDGETLSGRVSSRDATFIRLAPDLLRPSQTVTLANESIVSESQLDVSTMPPGLLNALNEDEVLDLLAYLLSNGDPEHPLFRAQPR